MEFQFRDYIKKAESNIDKDNLIDIMQLFKIVIVLGVAALGVCQPEGEISYLSNVLPQFSNPLSLVLPRDQADIILIMVLIIPIGFLLKLITNRYIFLLLTIALSMSFQSILFPVEKYFLWAQQQLVYILILVSPRKYVGHVIIVQSFMALIAVQLRRFYIAYGTNDVDITGIFMMQLFNYIGFGYNYANGALDDSQLNEGQIKRKIIARPSYLSYMGYVNFTPACLVGPVFEYSDYDNYLNRKGDYKSIPNPIKAVVVQMGIFLLNVSLYFLTESFELRVIISEQFSSYCYVYKIIYIMVTVIHYQFKYAAAWSLGMAGMRASGFTYNPEKNVVNSSTGVVEEYNFAKVEANNMNNFYLNPSLKVKADNWNISLQCALKRYVYENVYDFNEKDEKKRRFRQTRGQLITVLVSALWHGIYVGYYIGFVHWILFIQIIQEIYRSRKIEGTTFNILSTKYSLIYNIIQNFLSTFTITYYGLACFLLVWEKIQIYLNYTYYAPYIILYVFYFFVVYLRVLGKGKSTKGTQQKQQKND